MSDPRSSTGLADWASGSLMPSLKFSLAKLVQAMKNISICKTRSKSGTRFSSEKPPGWLSIIQNLCLSDSEKDLLTQMFLHALMASPRPHWRYRGGLAVERRHCLPARWRHGSRPGAGRRRLLRVVVHLCEQVIRDVAGIHRDVDDA